MINPAHNSLYMKNWYSPNECIRVFCESRKKEIAILHSKECRKVKSCPELPEASKKLFGETAKDEKGVIHLEYNPIMTTNEVDWAIMDIFIYYTDHITVKNS